MLIRSALNFAAHFAAGLAFGALAALVVSDRMRDRDTASDLSMPTDMEGGEEQVSAGAS